MAIRCCGAGRRVSQTVEAVQPSKRGLFSIHIVVLCMIGVAVAGGLSGWTLPARPAPLGESNPAVLRFLADGENETFVFSSGSGLDWSFDRDVVTVDPDGEHVPADEPRADRLVHIAAVLAPVAGGPFQPVHAYGGYILASGVDDTTSMVPMMVYLRVGVSSRRWPLFTLWGDADNWIEFSADCEGRGFRVRVKSDGGDVDTTDFGEGKQVWLPESPLLVAISFNSTGDELTFGASLGGGKVQMDDEAVISWAGDPLTLVKFRGAIGGFSEDGEVCEIRIIGGEINTSGAISSMPSAFADLGFLVP